MSILYIASYFVYSYNIVYIYVYVFIYIYIYILFVTKYLYIYYIYITPPLKWSIVKSVPGYSNITKKCLLCLYEKLEIINNPNQEELLNKRSELISKCRHLNKYLLSISKTPTEHYQFVIKFKIIRYGNVSHIIIFSVK